MSDETSASTHSYYVDPETAEEMSRLMRQDRLVTQAMGGPLPEPHDLQKMQSILDVACGPGGWVIDVAWRYSHLQVVGVDISETAIRSEEHTSELQSLAYLVCRLLLEKK